MVKRIVKKNAVVYQCESCNFLYKEKAWAEKCEAWCKKYKSCNMEITLHSVQM